MISRAIKSLQKLPFSEINVVIILLSMLKGSKEEKKIIIRRAGDFFSFFLFGVGRPDWSLTLMAINTFTICPKRFYALNTMYIVHTKLPYSSGNFHCVATAVLPPTTHQILLTHTTWGRRNSQRGYYSTVLHIHTLYLTLFSLIIFTFSKNECALWTFVVIIDQFSERFAFASFKMKTFLVFAEVNKSLNASDA